MNRGVVSEDTAELMEIQKTENISYYDKPFALSFYSVDKSESMRVPGLHIKILRSKHNETNQIGKLKD